MAKLVKCSDFCDKFVDLKDVVFSNADKDTFVHVIFFGAEHIPHAIVKCTNKNIMNDLISLDTFVATKVDVNTTFFCKADTVMANLCDLGFDVVSVCHDLNNLNDFN